MGPEDDLKREIRALLQERGPTTSDDIVRELQADWPKVSKALSEMRDIEALEGFAQVTKWRLNSNLDTASVSRFLGGISP